MRDSVRKVCIISPNARLSGAGHFLRASENPISRFRVTLSDLNVYQPQTQRTQRRTEATNVFILFQIQPLCSGLLPNDQIKQKRPFFKNSIYIYMYPLKMDVVYLWCL